MEASRTLTTQSGLWLPAQTLWRREVVRFLRQRSRVVGAFGTPLVFWLLAGAGLQRSFSHGADGGTGVSYAEYTFPGAIAAILLFTSIFSMISIIDDRRDGFLQGVLVAPTPRSAIVLGKVLGATTLAVGQAIIFLALAPLTGFHLGVGAIVATFFAMILVSIAVTSLGFWMAWKMESTQGFHAVMNLVLMPMLVLSGAFFPPSGSAGWLRWIMTFNPMTYCVSLIRETLYIQMPASIGHGQGGLWPALGLSVLFAAAMFGYATMVAGKESARAAN